MQYVNHPDRLCFIGLEKVKECARWANQWKVVRTSQEYSEPLGASNLNSIMLYYSFGAAVDVHVLMIADIHVDNCIHRFLSLIVCKFIPGDKLIFDLNQNVKFMCISMITCVVFPNELMSSHTWSQCSDWERWRVRFEKD